MAEGNPTQTALVAGGLAVVLLLNVFFSSSLQSDINNVESTVASNDADMATMNAELGAISDILDADLALIEVLDARIDALENESGDNTTAVQIAELQEEIDAIIDILDADLLLMEAVEADLDAAGTSISTVAADLNAVETQLAALEAKVATLETAVANINMILAEHTSRITMLEADHMADIYTLQAEHDIDIIALEAALESATSCQLVPFGR
ncbi:MAG: hypothetical protein CXT74_02885 [Methanobacteriota archaeon]|nr:MAG: hypothetical protein CXT74_02885 [Euryarchaeota archaeon]